MGLFCISRKDPNLICFKYLNSPSALYFFHTDYQVLMYTIWILLAEAGDVGLDPSKH